MDAHLGFALLPGEKLVRGKGRGRGQGGTKGICRALVASADPGKIACVKVEVEVHLLSAFVGKSKDEQR